jgi:hypothetical protein
VPTDPLGKESNRRLLVRILHWLVGEYGKPAGAPQDKRVFATRSLMLLAGVLPLVSLVVSISAGRYADDSALLLMLILFCSSVLLGLVALVLRIMRARGSSGWAVLLNLLGLGANFFYFLALLARGS